MRTMLLVPLGLILSLGAAHAGPCPPTITDDKRVDGGSAQTEHKFRYVSFYEGDPKDEVDLAPDDDGPDPSKLEQRWELTRTPGRPITMVCRYHGTDRTYVETVPAKVKSCTLIGEMGEGGEVIGSPKLSCK